MTEAPKTENGTIRDSSTIGGHIETWCPYAKDGVDATTLGELADNACNFITEGICQLAAAGIRGSFQASAVPPDAQEKISRSQNSDGNIV